MSEMNNDQNQESPATPEAPQPQPAPQPAGAAGALSKDDKTFAMLAHMLGIVTGFIGALVIYLIKKDQSAFVSDQAKEALNFQITICIGWFIAFVLTFVVIGVLLYPVLFIVNLIFCIVGGLKANDGVMYRYPFAIRLVK